jgi:hypothetical protein
MNKEDKALNRMSLRKNRFPCDAEILPEIPKKTQQNTPTTKETETDVCSICCESSEKIMYINCIKGGIQKNNFGRGSSGFKDKPICKNCSQKCRKICPFCRNHKLYIIETARFPKKKQPWAIREIERYEKIRKKKKKDKIEKYKLQRWDKEWERTIAWQRIYTQSGVVSIHREENIFSNFYSDFDYTLTM